MHILLSGISNCGVRLRSTLGHFEDLSGNDDVGGMSAAGPFLTVFAVAESCHFGFSCCVVQRPDLEWHGNWGRYAQDRRGEQLEKS
jgi:hypothetical protein